MNIRLLSVELDPNRLPCVVAEKEYYCQEKKMNDSAKIVNMINSFFRLDNKPEEFVYMVCLDSASHVLGVFEISHGGVDRSFCGPREIFQKALLSGAVGIVIIHNHVSGCTNPSDMDVLMCDRLKQSGEMIGIKLLDFLIIGKEGEYYSFAEKDLL